MATTSENHPPAHSPSREVDRDIEHEQDAEAFTERTPLLGRGSDGPEASDQSQPQRQRSALSILRSLQGGKQSNSRRWPSLLALLLLCIVVVLIIVLGFVTPSVIEEYASQAVDFNATSLSIESFTTEGVVARIQGDFVLDARKVRKKAVRDLGKMGTWIVHEVKSGNSKVEVVLPEYGNVLLGTAYLPSIKVDIRDGHTTHIDIRSDLEAGDVNGIRKIANDWIDGRLGSLRMLGKAKVPIKSGIFSFGTQSFSQEVIISDKDVPTIPRYTINKLNFHEVDIPTGKGMAADASITLENNYPVDFVIPPLGFGILVDNCMKSDPPIMVADATTDNIHIYPKQDVELNVTGVVRQLPDTLLEACPGSTDSPLDALLGRYIHGKTNTLYVRGSDSPSPDTPKWVTDLASSVTVPVPFQGKTFGHLIRNFTLADTHFTLPSPFADEGSPEANPRISAKVKALVALPAEMNFNLSVDRVRADADVFYHNKKLGRLDLRKWQAAQSTRLPRSPGEEPMLAVESKVENAPLEITNDDLFTDVLQDLLLGGKTVILGIKADVDVEVDTALGALTARRIPAEGEVPIKPISSRPPGQGTDHGDFASTLKPKIGNLSIIDTGDSSLTMSALVNITNPTEYTATIPYVDIHILVNGSLIAHATAQDLEITKGQNTNLYVVAVWQPLDLGGEKSAATGREFLSQYISGYNTSLTLKTHSATIPAQPALGKALSKFSIDFPTPSLHGPEPPKDGDGDKPEDPGKDKKPGPHFIEDATMHLITSTATFTLLSPLRATTLHVEFVNATAYYLEPGAEEAEPVGKIVYELPFAVPPVDEDGNGVQTPRLPVEWSLGSVGYDAVKNALGGTLKLSAYADVGIRIGKFREKLWFQGKGIGARIRL